jgi:hypothetical protein
MNNQSKLHPNIDLDFFKSIDTKEKAYWLGFIFADGCITLDKRKKDSKRFKLEINKKDEILLDNFASAIGFNLKYKSYREESNTVRIRLGNKRFISNLIDNGISFRKSNIIKFPKLDNRKLYLAFLLGYFDGDGTEGTSKITSGSKKFLKQIKSHFNIKSTIHQKFGYGKAYDLYLGAKLFNEMLYNYDKSLSRKRKVFTSNEQRISNIRKNAWKGGSQRKSMINKIELEELIWKMPKIKIAKLYGVSDTTICKYCRKWKIKVPPRGYWR